MNRAPSPPGVTPPPPAAMPTPGTLEWVTWHKQQTLTPTDSKVLDAIVTLATATPYGAEMDAHCHYSVMCHRMQWPGWKATLVWALIKASIPEDDIPF